MCALSVALPEFNGPLDLLIGLIQKRRLDVTAVSLAAVADQYLEQVLALDGELEALSEFLLLASQLLLIKSRALLPGGRLEADPEDLVAELERRLAEYQVLRAAAQWLGVREAQGERSWPRGGEASEAPVGSVLAPITLTRLSELACRRVTRSVPDVGTMDVVVRPSLRERGEVLFAASSESGWCSLDDLLGGDTFEAVATFLALLVLVRRGLLAVRQQSPYAEISFRRIVAGPVTLDALDD